MKHRALLSAEKALCREATSARKSRTAAKDKGGPAMPWRGTHNHNHQLPTLRNSGPVQKSFWMMGRSCQSALVGLARTTALVALPRTLHLRGWGLGACARMLALHVGDIDAFVRAMCAHAHMYVCMCAQPRQAQAICLASKKLQQEMPT